MEQPARQRALEILRQLAEGTDPFSGKLCRADSPYQQADTVRALFMALRALEAAPAVAAAVPTPARKPRPAGDQEARPKMQKVGQPWSQTEDETLAAGFDAGKPVQELALLHQRSRAGIEARLAKLGKITLPEGALKYPPRAQSPAISYEVRH